MKLKNTFILAKHCGTEKNSHESSGLCWKQGNLIVLSITLLHWVTLKCKISTSGTFHVSQGILQIFSRFCDLFTLYLQTEVSDGHSPVDCHLQALKAIFTTTTLFIYLFQMSEWCHRDSRAEDLGNNMTKQLRQTPWWSLLLYHCWMAKDTTPCFHPVFSGKSSQLPSLLGVSLLSDSHTEFASPPWCSGYIVEVCVKHKESWILPSTLVKTPAPFCFGKIPNSSAVHGFRQVASSNPKKQCFSLGMFWPIPHCGFLAIQPYQRSQLEVTPLG